MSNTLNPAIKAERKRQAKAWGVHLFTASGAMWGIMAILAIMQSEWQIALGWMGLAFMVDSFDGMLARRFKVKDTLPTFDGALLDNMVDYFTYTIIPALFLYQAELLPENWRIFGITILVLASSFQFAQGDAKSDGDVHFFKGFPSYWNVLVFYMLMLNFGVWTNLGLILFFCAMVFVPIKFVYQSRTIQYRALTLTLSVVWGILAFITGLNYPNHSQPLVYFSLFYVVYYLGISLFLMWKAKK